jgi:hypothetical protein
MSRLKTYFPSAFPIPNIETIPHHKRKSSSLMGLRLLRTGIERSFEDVNGREK